MHTISLTSSSPSDMTALLDCLIADAGTLRAGGVTFVGRQKGGLPLGSGVGIIVDLLVQLTSGTASGVLAAAIMKFFESRPTARVILEVRDGAKRIALTAEGGNASDLARLIERALPRSPKP
jgi:hypothetical protein